MTSSLRNNENAENAELMKQNTLHLIFDFFGKEFCDRLNSATKDFLGVEVYFTLTGASYEPSFLWRDSDYFVTQVNLGKEASLSLKISDTATDLLLTSSLGNRQDSSKSMKLKNLTELEARVINAYNEFLYKQINELFLTPSEINSVINEIKNQKTIYLVFYAYANNDFEAGRVILSFPEFVFKKIEPLHPRKEPLKMEFFKNSYIKTRILAGQTYATLDEIKSIEVEDLVILDNSNLHTMYLPGFGNAAININPDSKLIVEFDNEEIGEDIVTEEKTANKSIWDSLEVEVNAGFEKVRMKLGDLRNITEGLVIDVASIANNKVYIDVEGQKLAAGELVIIGDKYGVRITEIYSEAKSSEIEKLEEQGSEITVQDSQKEEEEDEESEHEELDEDFEESDFDLEDEEDDE